MDPEATRRGTRRTSPVDLAAFRTDVDSALNAFCEDPSYAVALARAAVTINRKRQVWQARRDEREGQRAA